MHVPVPTYAESQLVLEAPGSGEGVAPDASWAFYDGRATAEENFEERAGWAVAHGAGGVFEAAGGPIGSPHARHGLRYVDAVALPGGGHRLFYEAARADGAHELRTEIVGE